MAEFPKEYFSNMKTLKSVAVFCGGRLGNHAAFQEAAIALAQALVEQHIRLIYGGGRVGIMGVLADAMLARGGQVIGVIPQFLVDKEIAHEKTELHIVQSMHERKALLYQLADGFILLSGGLGSLDEFFETMTWNALNLHQKPCGILNTQAFYDRLLAFLDHATAAEFIPEANRKKIIAATDATQLLSKMMS